MDLFEKTIGLLSAGLVFSVIWILIGGQQVSIALFFPVFIIERFEMIKKLLVKLFGTKYSKIIYGLSQIAGVLISSIGISAVSGYLTRKQYLYKWFTNDVGVALGTGIALVFVGIALYFFSLRLDELADRVKNLENK